METKSEVQPPVDPAGDREEASGSRCGGRIRLAALVAVLATGVAAFGALVLPRVATDASPVSDQAGAPAYAVVIDYEYEARDRVGGCDRDDAPVTGDPAQQT
jgi:hypothetical protein